ncbi:hypothetical protein PC111_g4812 [Phytophthora cactorum]|nr:hypothetical protein PC111_g4812 [Phytophthora cactorum]
MLPLAALQAIETATRAAVAEQRSTKTSGTAGKTKVAKVLEVKAEEDETKPSVPAAGVATGASSSTALWQASNQLAHEARGALSTHGGGPPGGYRVVPAQDSNQYPYQGYGGRDRGFGDRGRDYAGQSCRDGGRGGRFGNYGFQGRGSNPFLAA